MKIIDLHEDLHIYLNNPQLLGYPSDYKIPAFDRESKSRHADIPQYESAGTIAIISAVFPLVFLSNSKTKPLSIGFMKKAALWHKNLAGAYSKLKLVLNRQDLQDAQDQIQIAVVMHLEGLGTVETPKEIDTLYKYGYRSVGLSWNADNPLCATCTDARDTGLTKKGYEVVKAIVENGMILDLTHASFKTQNDILDKFDYNKIMFSHCGVWEIYNFEQNIKKEVLTEIARRKGIVGITFLDLMLNGKQNTNINDFVKHAKSALRFEKSVGIGTDFFGFEFKRGIKNVDNMKSTKSLYEKLQKELGTDVATNLFYKNALNFLQANL